MENKTDMSKPFAFISYSHSDKEWVGGIVSALVASGYNIWFDDHSLEIAKEWEEQIQEGIAKCRVFIAIISNDYEISEFCQIELELVKTRKDLPILCIRDSDESVSDTTPVLKDYEKKQFLTWDFSKDEEETYLALQKFHGMDACRLSGSGVIEFTPLARLSLEHIERQKKNHPSFRMLEKSDADERLYPKGQHAKISGIQKNLSNEGLKDFIKGHWDDNNHYRHRLIIGHGGIGKTVSLLDIFSEKHYFLTGVPVVYIPLHVLVAYESIDEYIEKTYSNRLANLMISASEKNWNKGPRIVLLLDGYNEVPLTQRLHVEDKIHLWMEKPGVRIISTSRVVFELYQDKFMTFELHELDASIKQKYLGDKYNPDIAKVITTPLMLKIYTDVDAFKRLSFPELIHFRKADNPGSLIYDYLQRELYKIAIPESKDTGFPRKSIDEAFAVICTSPFISWEMVKGNKFTLSKTEFKTLAKQAVSFWYKTLSTLPEQMIEAEEYFEKEWKDDTYRWLESRQSAILTRSFAFFVKDETTENYSLIHQNFRDGLAAIHLLNLMDASIKELLGILSLSVPQEVLGFFADLSTDQQIRDLWNENKKTVPLSIQATENILYITHKHSDGDLSILDFSGMDLKDINLYRYRCTKSHSLKLSQNPNYFKNTKVYPKCFQPQAHTETITCLAMNASKELLASASADGKIMIWNMRTNRPHKDPIAIIEPAYSIHFADNDQMLVIQLHDGRIMTYAIDNGETKWIDTSKPELICATGQDNLVAAGFSDGTIEIHDKNHPYDMTTTTITNHGAVEDITFHGKDMCIAKTQDGSFLIDIHDTSRHLLLNHSNADPFALSRKNNKAFIIPSKGCFQIMDTRTGNEFTESIHAFDERIIAMSLSNNDEILSTVSSTLSIRFWTQDGQEAPVNDIQFIEALKPLALSDDQKDSLLETYSEQKGNTLSNLSNIDNVLCVSFASISHKLVCGTKDGYVILLDVPSLQPKTLYKHDDWVVSVSISPDGRFIASGSHDQTVHYFDLENSSHAKMKLESQATAVAVSPDGKHVICGSYENAIHIWNTEKNEYLKHHTNDFCTAIAFHPSQNIIAIGVLNGDIELFDHESKRSIQMLSGHKGSVNSLSFSPDGRYLCSGGDDSNVHIYNSNDWKCTVLTGHSDIVTSVAMDASGKHIASGSMDKIIRIWNIETNTHEEFPMEHAVISLTSDASFMNVFHCGVNGTLSAYSPISITKDSLRQASKPAAPPSSKSLYHDMFPQKDGCTPLLAMHGRDLLCISNEPTILKADCESSSFSSRIPPIPNAIPSAIFWYRDEDNDFLVVGTQDGRVYVQDLVTMKIFIQPIQTQASHITSITFDDDNDILYFASESNMILSWNINTYAWESIKTQEPVISLTYDKKTRKLIVRTNNKLFIYSAKDHLPQCICLDDDATSTSAFTVDANGNYIAGTAKEGICMWKCSPDSDEFEKTHLQDQVDNEELSLTGLNFSKALFDSENDRQLLKNKGINVEPTIKKKRIYFK